MDFDSLVVKKKKKKVVELSNSTYLRVMILRVRSLGQ